MSFAGGMSKNYIQIKKLMFTQPEVKGGSSQPCQPHGMRSTWGLEVGSWGLRAVQLLPAPRLPLLLPLCKSCPHPQPTQRPIVCVRCRRCCTRCCRTWQTPW